MGAKMLIFLVIIFLSSITLQKRKAMKKVGIFNEQVEQLYVEVTGVIENSRTRIFRAANVSMVRSYWEIGRLLVEGEQKGEERATYGEKVLEALSVRLQSQYGKGYTVTNLRYMRLFYKVFAIITHCVMN